MYHDPEFSDLGCVDCTNLDENDEGPVLRYSTIDRKITHVLAETFEAYFLKKMKSYLEENDDELLARVRLEMDISPDDPISSLEVLSQWFNSQLQSLKDDET